MAQIVVFGRVMHELVGQSKQQYVCFDLMERSGNTPPDYYQVWARGDDVTRLMRLKVKKGSMIWLTGSQKLVDVRQKDGTTVKKLKIWLTDFGFLPGQSSKKIWLTDFGFLPGQSSKAKSESGQHDPDDAAPVPSPPEVMNGDREPLPE